MKKLEAKKVNLLNEVTKGESNFKKYQASHKAAKIEAKTVGKCLAWVISNHEDEKFVEAAKVAQSEYKLFIESNLVKANKAGNYNAYLVGWAAFKYAGKK